MDWNVALALNHLINPFQCGQWGRPNVWPDKIIFQGQKLELFVRDFVILLPNNKLAEFGLTYWPMVHWVLFSSIHAAFWAGALMVATLHNQVGVSTNRSCPNKYHLQGDTQTLFLPLWPFFVYLHICTFYFRMHSSLHNAHVSFHAAKVNNRSNITL